MHTVQSLTGDFGMQIAKDSMKHSYVIWQIMKSSFIYCGGLTSMGNLVKTKKH